MLEDLHISEDFETYFGKTIAEYVVISSKRIKGLTQIVSRLGSESLLSYICYFAVAMI